MLTLLSQVDNRLQSLSGQYDGPQPSDLCDLLEGEQFFAGFERGLDISAGLKSWFGSPLYSQRGVIMCWVCVGNGKMTCCCFLLSRETRLCGGQAVFCVLLQPEESERSLHLCSSGSERASEGTSKTLCSTDKNAP